MGKEGKPNGVKKRWRRRIVDRLGEVEEVEGRVEKEKKETCGKRRKARWSKEKEEDSGGRWRGGWRKEREVEDVPQSNSITASFDAASTNLGPSPPNPPFTSRPPPHLPPPSLPLKHT